MVATWGRAGYASSNWFTFSVKAMTDVSLSVVFRVVSSTLPIRNFFTSGVSFSCTLVAMISFTASFTSWSLMSRLYFDRASSIFVFSAIILSFKFGVFYMSQSISFCLFLYRFEQFFRQVNTRLVC